MSAQSQSLVIRRSEGQDLARQFQEFIRAEVAGGDVSLRTLAIYKAAAANWLRWCQGQGLAPAYATRADVAAYREHLVGPDHEHPRKAVSTRALALSVVRRFYDGLIANGMLTLNPARGVKAGKDGTAPADRVRYFDRAELAAIIEATPTDSLRDLRDRLVLGLLGIQALRRAEVCSLNLGDLEGAGEDARVTITGKGRKRRVIYVEPSVAARCQEYLARLEQSGVEVEPDSAGVPLIVSLGRHSQGQRLAVNTINQLVNRAFARAGVKRRGMGPHALRHSAAALAIRGGARIEDVAPFLGHASVTTTMLYAHLATRRDHNPARCVGVQA